MGLIQFPGTDGKVIVGRGDKEDELIVEVCKNGYMSEIQHARVLTHPKSCRRKN